MDDTLSDRTVAEDTIIMKHDLEEYISGSNGTDLLSGVQPQKEDEYVDLAGELFITVNDAGYKYVYNVVNGMSDKESTQVALY
ncbi:MAG TPA: hypothetical protein H9869_00295 [Candidatus Ligilactobacillus excrementipullorum]|nr:hypothetical protein [Candidatus Ligilactobacillus excrementipullorum]